MARVGPSPTHKVAPNILLALLFLSVHLLPQRRLGVGSIVDAELFVAHYRACLRYELLVVKLNLVPE